MEGKNDFSFDYNIKTNLGEFPNGEECEWDKGGSKCSAGNSHPQVSVVVVKVTGFFEGKRSVVT